jgi:predicted RNA polymerase sigma factor
LIGECFFNIGNYEKAYISFDRASTLCKDEEYKEFLQKRANLMKEMFIASKKKL